MVRKLEWWKIGSMVARNYTGMVWGATSPSVVFLGFVVWNLRDFGFVIFP